MEIGYSDFNLYFDSCWNFPRSDKLHELRNQVHLIIGQPFQADLFTNKAPLARKCQGSLFINPI